jgi:hypothetical protein
MAEFIAVPVPKSVASRLQALASSLRRRPTRLVFGGAFDLLRFRFPARP